MFFEIKEQKIILLVRLTPNSSFCKINGIFTSVDGSEYLKINVFSVPEKGKANKELVAFLAESLKISKSSIKILKGATDNYKKLEISGEVSMITEKLKKLMR